jgi:hypothetical protein
MKVLEVRNVHDALIRGIDLLEGMRLRYIDDLQYGCVSTTRAGEVIHADTPVTTVYRCPTERVLFWPERDANPFFHFMEGVWMLAGRNDLAYVHQYNKGMEKFSDDGETLHGAYGWRWRNFFCFDQLETISNILKNDPTDRRCVLQMWDASQDLQRNGKDVPCNTCIYFKIDKQQRLQMTVSNRSNDIIWGAYGANAVHMSMLQEYMAARIGVPVGIYYQVSDNYHAYVEIYDKLVNKLKERDVLDFYAHSLLMHHNPYAGNEVSPYPMVNVSIHKWEQELYSFLSGPCPEEETYTDPFFSEVAVPMHVAWKLHKNGDTEMAYRKIKECKATDWGRACAEWLNRRLT